MKHFERSDNEHFLPFCIQAFAIEHHSSINSIMPFGAAKDGPAIPIVAWRRDLRGTDAPAPVQFNGIGKGK
jgi:hypothetical protein